MALNKVIHKEKDHQHLVYILEDPNASTKELHVNHHGLPMLGLVHAIANIDDGEEVE